MPRAKNKSRQPPTPLTPSLSSRKATAFLTFLCAILWGIFCGIVLSAIGKLPAVIVAIVSSLQVVVLFFIGVFGTVGTPLKTLIPDVWKKAHHILSIVLGITIATILAFAVYFLVPAPQPSNPSILPSPHATMIATKWHSLLKQQAPNCNNQKGTIWLVHKAGTSFTCNDAYLSMQRISPNYYADMELVEVNNNTYNQTAFRVQVDATFQNPTDTATLATLLIQTPAQVGAVGGYLFSIDSKGQCQLQEVMSSTDIPTISSAAVTIDPSKPVLITIVVKDGLLVVLINNQIVISYNDNLNPQPGQVGLLVEGPSPSSPIFYSNFELSV